MSEAPADLTPADLAAVFPPGRVPTQFTLIPAGCEPPRRFTSRFDLAMAVAQLLEAPDGQGRELVLTRTVITYPGFDTFNAFSVQALGLPGESGVRSALWLAAVAIPGLTPEDLDADVAQAQARLRMRGAA